MYLLRDLAHKSGAALTAPIESRIHMLEQAESLRGAVAKLLPRISGPETVWAVYGDTPWLVGLSSPATLLAIDARPLLSTLSNILKSPPPASLWARSSSACAWRFLPYRQ